MSTKQIRKTITKISNHRTRIWNALFLVGDAYAFQHQKDSSLFWMFIIMVIVAILLVPARHLLEKWVTRRLVEKNKRIRLEAAKKTIKALLS